MSGTADRSASGTSAWSRCRLRAVVAAAMSVPTIVPLLIGCLIGIAGLALGLSMGLVITANLDLIQRLVEATVGFDVLPADVYQLGKLPYHVEPLQLVIISLIAMVLSIGATLLPSWQASRLDPAEGLRYE